MISWNVLFANDDVLTQWVMTEVLTGAGFTVSSACRGPQVVAMLKDTQDFDVLLIDTALAEVTIESDVSHQWRRLLPGRPIIYTGAHRDGLRRPLQANESFLPTPFSAGALLRCIDSALEEASFGPFLPAMLRASQHVH